MGTTLSAIAIKSIMQNKDHYNIKSVMKEAEEQLLSLIDDLFASRGLRVRVQGMEDLQD